MTDIDPGADRPGAFGVGGFCAFYYRLLAEGQDTAVISLRLRYFAVLLAGQFVLGRAGDDCRLACVLPLHGAAVACFSAVPALLPV